jgi:hypothetical protein
MFHNYVFVGTIDGGSNDYQFALVELDLSKTLRHSLVHSWRTADVHFRCLIFFDLNADESRIEAFF